MLNAPAITKKTITPGQPPEEQVAQTGQNAGEHTIAGVFWLLPPILCLVSSLFSRSPRRRCVYQDRGGAAAVSFGRTNVVLRGPCGGSRLAQRGQGKLIGYDANGDSCVEGGQMQGGRHRRVWLFIDLENIRYSFLNVYQ